MTENRDFAAELGRLQRAPASRTKRPRTGPARRYPPALPGRGIVETASGPSCGTALPHLMRQGNLAATAALSFGKGGSSTLLITTRFPPKGND